MEFMLNPSWIVSFIEIFDNRLYIFLCVFTYRINYKYCTSLTSDTNCGILSRVESNKKNQVLRLQKTHDAFLLLQHEIGHTNML